MDTYSIERHLEQICKENNEFELLQATWVLNKSKIPKALSSIGFTFPHFTDHGKNHSDTIIKNIEMLLGKSGIETLSATDAWLILMASYTHDLGMVVAYQTLEKKWKSPEFLEYIEGLKSGSDKDLLDAALFLEKIEKRCKGEGFEFDLPLNWALQVRKKVILLISDYFRKTHAKSSEKIILDNDIMLISDSINLRLLKLIGVIVSSHQNDFSFILENIEFETNGLSRDYAHPRLISVLLRLGDLLDLESGRFNIFMEMVFGKLPNLSEIHKKKHASISQLLITPNKIKIKADCEDNIVYRETRKWIDYIINDVKNLSLNWNSIVPKNIEINPISFDEKDVELCINGDIGLIKQADLRFSISQEKAINILEKSNLYEDNYAFIREIYQNAIDALKIQLWDDLLEGIFDGILVEHLQCNKEDIIENIKFPYNIPSDIYKNYEIYIEVGIDKQKRIFIRLTDNGCGINDEDINRIVNVGNSWKSKMEYKNKINNMPYFLKPTGAFGIGLQSVFLVTDEFDIYTKTSCSKNTKRINLIAKKNEGYITVQNSSEGIKKRGTQVFVTLNNTLLPKKISITESEDFNPLSHSDDEIQIFQIIKYIADISNDNIYFNIKFKTPDSFNLNEFRENSERKMNVITEDYEKCNLDNYRYRIEIKNNNLIIYIHENKFGSYLKLIPIGGSDFKDQFPSIQLFFKSITIKNTLHGTNHFSYIEWNLISADTENYLNFSRNEILSSRMNILYKNFDIINSDLSKILLDISNNIDNNKICDFVKFNLNILSYLYHKQTIFSKFTNDNSLDLYLPFKYNDLSIRVRTPVMPKDFFTIDELIFGIYYGDAALQTIEDKVISYLTENTTGCYVLYSNEGQRYDQKTIKVLETIRNYIKKFFVLSEILMFEGNRQIIKLRKATPSDEIEYKIACTKEITKVILKSRICNNLNKRFNTMYPISNYSENLTVKYYPRGFYHVDSINMYNGYCKNYSIIVPIIYDGLIDSITCNDYQAIKTHVLEKFSEYINPHLIEWVKKYNLKKDVTEELIIESYKTLIADIIATKKNIDIE